MGSGELAEEFLLVIAAKIIPQAFGACHDSAVLRVPGVVRLAILEVFESVFEATVVNPFPLRAVGLVLSSSAAGMSAKTEPDILKLCASGRSGFESSLDVSLALDSGEVATVLSAEHIGIMMRLVFSVQHESVRGVVSTLVGEAGDVFHNPLRLCSFARLTGSGLFLLTALLLFLAEAFLFLLLAESLGLFLLLAESLSLFCLKSADHISRVWYHEEDFAF